MNNLQQSKIINFCKKLIIFSFILLIATSCPETSTDPTSLEFLQQFDSTDRGTRFPDNEGVDLGSSARFNGLQDFSGDGDINDDDFHVRWGRRKERWHHACSSESLKPNISGQLMEVLIPLEVRLFAFLVTNVTGVDLVAALEDLFKFANAFADYEFDMTNPSCSAIAAVHGAALSISAEAVDIACMDSPMFPKGSNIRQKVSAVARKATSAGYGAASAILDNAITLRRVYQAVKFYGYCKSALGNYTMLQGAAAACAAGTLGVGAGSCTPLQSAATKAGISSARCCASVAAFEISFASAIAEIMIKYEAANRHHKKVAVCGFDWHGWKNIPQEVVEDNDPEYREIRGPYHSNINGNSELRYFSYHKILLDLERKNKLERNLQDQRYREILYGGREIYDPTLESRGGCVMPKISNNKLKLRFGYNEESDGEIRQRYYFRGSNTTPNFACQRFKPDPNKLLSSDIAAYQEAYDCCINRSRNIICLEYINEVQEYVTDNGNNIDTNHDSNKPIRSDIDFCQIGKKDCSLGNISDIPVAYEAYTHPTNDKYICARSYSVCPYNFTVGTGTAVSGTDIDYQDEDPGGWFQDILPFLSEIGFVTDPDVIRGQNNKGYNDCQYFNHCTIRPGDLEDTDYQLATDGDSYFISSACYDGKGDSQNYFFKNDLMADKNNVSYLTAPIAQCIIETFDNLLLNKYGSDNDGGIKGQTRTLPSFLDKIQNNVSDILRLLLVCAVTLLGYRMLLAGGVERKELLPFILKIAFVMYFVSGNAWKFVFTQGVSAISNQLAATIVYIDNDDVNIYPDNSDFTILDNAVFEDIVDDSQLEYLDIETIPGVSCNENTDSCKSEVFGIDAMQNSRLFKLKNKPRNGYYFKKNYQIYNISSNNICKFPRYNYAAGDNMEPSYPNGKEYLRIFDNLDCIISYAFGVGVLSSGGSLGSAIAMSFLNGFIGMAFAITSLFFVFSLIAVAIKVLSIFTMCSVYVALLIFVSPITITCILFDRTKDIFQQWFRSLLSYSIQPIFIFIFAGMFISIFNHIIVTDDIRYEYQISKGDVSRMIVNDEERLPFLNCNDWNYGGEIIEPSKTSIYCFFNKIYNPNDEDADPVLTGLARLGMHFVTIAEIAGGATTSVVSNNGNNKFTNMLQIAVLMYILNKLSSLLPNLIVNMTSGAQIGNVGGFNVGAGDMSRFAKSAASSAKDIARGGGMKYGSRLSGKAKSSIGFGNRKPPGGGNNSGDA